ncbi:zinc finger and SCAN domain-containing protein 12 [Clonorchis sinensis]|uniref:Zinc finger and SCAN domain-containing protein 12 n=1 Tax=Clonorchis sinensis TaxID=79923 RepID=H2KSA4_CLOSI|nr:zinc finger and SCAN domain-containing protein 12 [Clonorchis sinensis]
MQSELLCALVLQFRNSAETPAEEKRWLLMSNTKMCLRTEEKSTDPYRRIAYASSVEWENVTQDVEQPQDAAERTKVADKPSCRKPHDRLYKCPICSNSFSHLSKALEHQKSHSTDRDIHCSICSCSFKHKSSLRRHTEKEHTGQTDYLLSKTPNKRVRESAVRGNPCPECGKKFTRWNALQEHQKSMHAKGGRYMCDECGILLSYKQHLLRHVREVHSRDFQKRCEQCGGKFSRSYLLKRHIELVHGGGQAGN